MTSPDEDLPGQDGSRLRPRTLVVLVTGALLLVIGTVVAVQGHDRTPRAAPSRTSSVPVPDVDRTTAQAAPCVDGVSCRVSIGVPQAVVVAVRSTFPSARIDGSYTVTGRDRRLYVRRLSIVGDHRQVTLTIGVSERSTRHYEVRRGTMDTVTRFETTARTDAQHLTVRIDVLDRQHRAGIARTVLDDLAHDPRLLALL